MTSIKDTDNTKKPKHATVDDDVNDLAIEDIVGQWNLKHRTLLLNYLDNAFTSKNRFSLRNKSLFFVYKK